MKPVMCTDGTTAISNKMTEARSFVVASSLLPPRVVTCVEDNLPWTCVLPVAGLGECYGLKYSKNPNSSP